MTDTPGRDPLPEVRQILVSAGPLWDALAAWFKTRGLLLVGPLPLGDDGDLPTYTLQPTAELWAKVQAEPEEPTR